MTALPTATAYDRATRDMSHEQARAARECAEWQLWLATEGKRPQTREDYLRTAANLLRRNPDTPFPQFTSAQVMECLVGYPRGSQRKVRAHLQSFFAWGVLHNLIDRNPRVPRIRRPTETDEWEYTTAGRVECATCGEWIYTRRKRGRGGPHVLPPECQVCGAPS